MTRRFESGQARSVAARFVGAIVVALAAAVCVLATTSPVNAQRAEARSPAAVSVFLDCQTRGCASREFRTEITYVDWVRDRTAADVHVIMTSQDAGAGDEYVLDFIGQGDLAEMEDRLTHTVADTDTRDERLRGLTRVLGAGLVRYVARRGLADRLEIRRPDEGESGDDANVAPQDDPWNYWVFRTGLDIEADGEELRGERQFRVDLSANRTTPEWKLDIGIEADLQREEVTLSDGRVFRDDRDDWEFGLLLVRSVADHWATGFEVDAGTSTQRNRRLSSRSAAALEWNLFPYEEANRRQLIIHYQVAVSRTEYEERTIFDKLEEDLGDHRLSVVYNTRQRWGNVSGAVHYSNYLHDWSKRRVSFDGGLNLRIFRGLDLRVNGGYEIVRDQLYLPAEDLSDEDILVQRRQLETGYEYELRVGISYRFGSIYNNVVNNRFPWTVRRF